MAKASEIIIRIGADTYKLEKSLKDSEKSLKKSVKKMGEIGSNLTRSLTLPIAGVGAAAVASFAKFEKLNKALIAVSGSSDKAKVELEQLRDAAKLPGLNFEEAVRGSVRLQAVGLSADEARKSLITFGTAIAASGGGAENLERVVYQLTQMISKNRILQEDFGIIQENIPLIGGALEKAFGSTNIEAIRATGISAAEFNQRLVDALAELPELQGDLGGLSNSFENVKSAVQNSLIALGDAINKTFDLQGLAEKLSGFIERATGAFDKLEPSVKATVIQIAAIAAAIGPVLLAISGLTAALGVIISPIGLTVIAIAGLASAMVILYNNSEKARGVFQGFYNVASLIVKELTFEITKFGNAFGLLISNPRKFREAWAILNEEGPAAGKSLADAFNEGYNEGIAKEIRFPNFEEAIEKAKEGVASIFETPPTSSVKVGNQQTTPRDKIFIPELSIDQQKFTEVQSQFDSLSTSVESNTEKMRAWSESLNIANESTGISLELTEKLAENYQGVTSVLQAAGNAMVNAALSGEKSFKKLGQAALKGAADVLRAKLIEATAAYLADAFKKLGLLGGVLALAGSAIVGGIFNSAISALKIPALAEGGLAYSPTLAVVGDNAGAGADPEVIAPLSKLKQYLGSGNQVMGTFRIAGRDLELVLERSQNDSSRVSPI